MIVKLGICVAYDWEFLQYSLPAIYNHVESICLSVDSRHKSWNGNKFSFDDDRFLRLINTIDGENKIQILREAFFDVSRVPIENENYQRQRMAEFLGEADWIVQIDTDEIFLNADEFFRNLQKYAGVRRKINIHGIWINLIKQTKKGFVYSVLKTPPLATNYPAYEYGRTNGHFGVYTNVFLAHITWARPKEEVLFKLDNWGHSIEFSGNGFFQIWEVLNEENWQYVKNLHPMPDPRVKELFHIDAESITAISKTGLFKHHSLSKADLRSNLIWYSRFKQLFKLLNKTK